MKKSCDSCFHNEICGIKEKLKGVNEKIEKCDIKTISPFINIEVKCSKWAGKNIEVKEDKSIEEKFREYKEQIKLLDLPTQSMVYYSDELLKKMDEQVSKELGIDIKPIQNCELYKWCNDFTFWG